MYSRVRGETEALGWAYFGEPGLNTIIEVILKIYSRVTSGEYISSAIAQQGEN
jgi:hypothetical protein